jgi:ABC-type transport system involved in cytochrome bd biosynthesis fused ATPase/permease subunit
VSTQQTRLRHFAGWLIAASALAGLVAIGVRAGWGGAPARALEGATLFLAAAAYVAHVVAHHETFRETLTRSVLVSAFALWGVVQIAPGLPGSAVLNDVVIVLFVVDLAIIVSPWL